MNASFIFLILLAFVLIVLATLNVYSSGKIYKKKLQDNLKDRDYFRRTYKYYLRKLYKQIINFKSKHNLYWLSDFEQDRRSTILNRYYFNLDENIDYRYFDAHNVFYIFLLLFFGSITGIALVSLVPYKILHRSFIAILIFIACYILFFRYKIIENKIKQEDEVLNRNFGDFFLVQYRILMNTAKKPLEKGLKANLVVTKNATMLKFINNSLYLIESEGEEQAIEKMIKWYSDIHYLNRFLIMEQQIIRGADATTDLLGLRTDVLKEKEEMIEAKCYQIVRESNMIVWLAMFLTIQVSLGALAYVVQQSGIFR